MTHTMPGWQWMSQMINAEREMDKLRVELQRAGFKIVGDSAIYEGDQPETKDDKP